MSDLQRIAKTLLAHRAMLAEYFEIHITPDGDIESLPHLLKEYTPDLNKLPIFLMRLGPQVRRLLPWMIPTAVDMRLAGAMANRKRMLLHAHARDRLLLFPVAVALCTV